MQGQVNRKIRNAKLQRQLRNTPTDAEHRLWQHLRGRQLESCKFRRQHPFLDYVLDFVCIERALVVEIDGGQYASSGNYDLRRTTALEKAGFVVLRFWNNDVLVNMDGVLQVIQTPLCERMTPSPPNPPLEGEG